MSLPVMDDEAAADARNEGAIFAPARLRGSGSRRVVAALVVACVAAFIVFNAANHQADSPAIAVATFEVPTATARPVTATATRPPRARPSPAASAAVPPDALLDVDVRPAGSYLFIHGDVFSLEVKRVRVRLEDGAGHVAATTSVDIPGGSTAFRLGAVPRFDVHFALADEVQSDGYVILVAALDASGHRIGTVLERVPRSDNQM